MLGVNTDSCREPVARAEASGRIPWRSCCDGPAGPIARAWKVQSLPSLFLVDARGHVRWEGVGVPDQADLERRIEELVKEAEKGRQETAQR